MLNKAEYISFSRINCLSSCGQKYSHRYIEKSERLEAFPDFLTVGNVIDDALESAQAERTETFADYVEEKKKTFNDEKWFHFCAGIWSGRRDLFKRIYGDNKVELQKPIKIPLVDMETGDLIENEKGETMYIFGIADAYDSENNKLYEVKSTAAVSDALFTGHRFGGQTQLYSLGITMDLKISRPEVQYVYVKKPSQIKQKKSETVEDFHTRIMQIGMSPDITIQPLIVYPDEEMQETFKHYFDLIRESMKAKPVKNKNECMNMGKCEFFGHCWKCQVGDNEWIIKE